MKKYREFIPSNTCLRYESDKTQSFHDETTKYHQLHCFVFRLVVRRVFLTPAGVDSPGGFPASLEKMASYAATSNTSPARLFSKIRSTKISKDCKQVIVNVYSSARVRFPDKSVREILQVVSEETGVSVRTVAKYKAECLSGHLASPKRRPRNVKISSTRTSKNDSFTLNAIRLKMHRMFAEKVIPTLENLLEAVNEDDQLTNMSRSTLWRLLSDIGFTFEKRKRRHALIERSDIIAWRRRYLRAIKEFRRQGRYGSLFTFLFIQKISTDRPNFVALI